MALVDIDRAHHRPAPPSGPVPVGLNRRGSTSTDEIRLEEGEVRPLPMGRSKEGKMVVRGASTLDPEQAKKWQERRSSIQEGLSRGGSSVSPSSRTGSFGRAAKAAKSVGGAVKSAFGFGKHASHGVKRGSVNARRASAVALSPHALNVCKEVRDTEEIYINDLRTVLEVYVRPAIEQRIMTLEDTQAIFANIEELCRCAQVLLDLMDREGDRATVLAHAFIQVTPFFKLYSFYCRNYERALTTLANCRKHVNGLTDFLNTQARLPQCKGLSLESYLIKPVQRLTKYPLFWKDLLKAVPHTHPARDELEKADELVRTVSMAVNQTLTDELTRLKTVQVLKELGTDWMDLIAPHRKLVLEFTGSVHVGIKNWNACGYVLTDLLIICQKGSRDRKTPWLLAELTNVIVNQDMNLEALQMDFEEGSQPNFGVQPPMEVPRSRLLNLRLREREGMPADEEYWLELTDEALAYKLGDEMPALSKAAMQHADHDHRPRNPALYAITDKLKDKRVGKRPRGGGPRDSRASKAYGEGSWRGEASVRNTKGPMGSLAERSEKSERSTSAGSSARSETSKKSDRFTSWAT